MRNRRTSEPVLLCVRVDGDGRQQNFLRPALRLDELVGRCSANR